MLIKLIYYIKVLDHNVWFSVDLKKMRARDILATVNWFSADNHTFPQLLIRKKQYVIYWLTETWLAYGINPPNIYTLRTPHDDIVRPNLLCYWTMGIG